MIDDSQNPTVVVGAKVGAVWFAGAFGAFTDFPISKAVLWLTALYTAVQIYKLVTDLWRAAKERKAASTAFAAKLAEPDASSVP
jgi:hypothetical protein